MSKKVDKRTKAYKDAQKKKKLGDKVADVIKATGLDKLAPEDCGCNERRIALNDLDDKIRLKWNRLFGSPTVNELNAKDYDYLCDLFKNGKTNLLLTPEVQIELYDIHYRVSGIRKRPNGCSSCARKVAEGLYKMYKDLQK